MHDPLAPLLHDGVIDEIVARLKSGKEADLWLVRHGGETVAAKVYKAREARSFRNDAVYREGRRVRNTRTQRAMDRGSRFGQAAAEEAWKSKEADALHLLHAAGVRVPRPVLFYEGVLLMELVLDGAGHPAPRLVDAQIPRERASALYAELRAQAVAMLCHDLIHGDLSPYNVLLGARGPVVIDFPQVIGAAHNSQAEGFFARDLGNLQRFFATIDPALRTAAGDPQEIWRAYTRRELTPDFLPSGRPPPPARPAPPAHSHPPPRQHPHQPAHPRNAGGQAGPHPRDRRGGGPPPGGADSRPGRRGPRPEVRRHAPAPEVVRVSRSPSGQAGQPARPPAAGAPRPRPHAPRPGVEGARRSTDPGARGPRRHRRRR